MTLSLVIQPAPRETFTALHDATGWNGVRISWLFHVTPQTVCDWRRNDNAPPEVREYMERAAASIRALGKPTWRPMNTGRRGYTKAAQP